MWLFFRIVIQNFLKNKKLVSFTIVLCALIISVIIIYRPTPDKKGLGTNMPVKKIDTENKISPTLTFETNPLENMTLKFANSLTKAALDKNFYQDELKKPALINPKDTSTIEKIISKIIDEELNKIAIKKSDISVNEKNSPDIQKIYLLYLNQVISDIPNFQNINENEETNMEDVFINAANNLETAIQLLKIFRVPPSWVDIHYKILVLLTYQKNIFLSLTKNVDDPLRFLIAIYQIKNDPLSEGLKIIQKEIEQKIKDEKLI